MVLALIGWGAWTLWHWQFGSGAGGEAMNYAEMSCVDTIRARYDVSNVRANSVRPNEKGYVVRASMTLSRGGVARATCLTNENGTVEDILIEER